MQVKEVRVAGCMNATLLQTRHSIPRQQVCLEDCDHTFNEVERWNCYSRHRFLQGTLLWWFAMENSGGLKDRNKLQFFLIYKSYYLLSEKSWLWNCDFHIQDLIVESVRKLFFNQIAANSPFLYPLKNPYGFLMFSRGKERMHWDRMT